MMYEKYLLRAIQASLEAGRAILDVYNSDFTVETKADSSPLTLADMRSHEIIVSHLRIFDIPILSEEGREVSYRERQKWEVLWIVDPLDGTKEFVSRNGEFTVNVALVKNGTVTVGVVYIPDKRILYFAAPGMGAYRLAGVQAKELSQVSKGTSVSHVVGDIVGRAQRLPVIRTMNIPLVVAGSRSHATAELEKFIEEKRREHGDVTVISAGSSLKFCLVAEGRADVYPRFGPTMEWDTAAGQAVAENAGAEVLDFATRFPLVYNKEDLRNPSFIVIKRGLSKM